MHRKIKQLMVLFVFVTLAAAAFGPLAAQAAAVVSVNRWPYYVSLQTPPDDGAYEGGAAYRGAPNGAAPFVVVAQIAGASGSQVKLWLTDNVDGESINTYDRFNGACPATYAGNSTCWLADGSGASVTPVNLNAANFYVMVVGRLADTQIGGRELYLHYEIDVNGGAWSADESGNLPVGMTRAQAADSTDWLQNWDDTGSPESGDPRPSADYVELKIDGVRYTTAPVDASGYYQMPLADTADGSTVVAEGMGEGGGGGFSWVQTISSSPDSFNELIFTGSGAPTAVQLSTMSARSGLVNSLVLFFGAGLVALALLALWRWIARPRL